MSELHSDEYKTSINQELIIGFNFSFSLKNGDMPDGLEEDVLKEKSDEIYENALKIAKDEIIRFYPNNYESGSGDFTIDHVFSEEDEDGNQIENDYSVVVDFSYEVVDGYLGGRRFETMQNAEMDLEKEFSIKAEIDSSVDDEYNDEYSVDCSQAFDEVLSDIKNAVDQNILSGEEEISIEGVTYTIHWDAE